MRGFVLSLIVSVVVGCGSSSNGAASTQDSTPLDSGSDVVGDVTTETASDVGSETTSDAPLDAAGASCASEDDCFGPTPHCDTAKKTCVGCALDSDCRGGLFCDTKTGTCHDCVTDAHCSAPTPKCDSVSGQCTATCTADGDCASTLGKGKCDPTRHVCVDCIGNGMSCKFCETVTFSCVGCLKDADCPSSAPFCGPSLDCTAHCTSDSNCSGGLHCDPITTFCVECATNKHCPGHVCQPNHTCG